MICLAVGLCGSFVVVGLALTTMSGRAVAEGRAVVGWPQTTATVTHAEKTADGDTERVTVRYSYTVDGVDHEGTGIHPTYRGSNDGRVHRDLLAVLRPGVTVRVHYRPDAPATSYLTAGLLSGPLAILCIGLLFVLGGGGFGLLFAEQELVGPNPNGGVGGAVLMTGVPLGLGLGFWFALFGDWRYAARVQVVEPAASAEVSR